MNLMNVKELAWHAELHQSRHERSLREILDRLRQIDPEVAERAVYVFSGKSGAAHWITSPVLTLGSITPLQALAEGRRRDVLHVLSDLFYGLYG
jgi:uncharacterized protein (DUF2384 family)